MHARAAAREPWRPGRHHLGGVQDERRRPCPYRYVGQRGMHGVAEPGAVQEVAHRLTVVPEEVEQQCDAVLEVVARLVQPLLAFHHRQETRCDVSYSSHPGSFRTGR